MKAKIPYGRQSVTERDIESVIAVLRSDFLTQGPLVPEFEASVSSYCGSKYAVATNSATSALHIACLALGVGPKDRVWTTAITFVASANCARYCGAEVDFVDIDPTTYNMSAAHLQYKLERAEQDGTLPKVVIPVHMCGQPCDMAAIHSLSKRYGFNIIEDASHALGAKYRERQVGSCQYSDITIFSFHPVKIITSGEGGMAVTNNHELAQRLRRGRSHGVTSSRDEMMPTDKDELWFYQQMEIGFNYRMTDIHAALGISQLTRVGNFVSSRNRIAKFYNNTFEDLPISSQEVRSDCESSYHLYVVRIKSTSDSVNQQLVFKRLLSSGIGVNLHYIPVYRQPYYRSLGFKKGYCPEAEKYFLEAMSIPIYPDLQDCDRSRVVCEIKSALLS